MLVTNSPYRLGVLSRGHPIALRGEQLAGFGHGLLHVEIDGWAYFITHLTPDPNIPWLRVGVAAQHGALEWGRANRRLTL